MNKQYVELGEALLPEDGTIAVPCECGLPRLRREDQRGRRRVRASATRPHGSRSAQIAWLPDLEDVVAEHDGWVVVEKHEPVKSSLEEHDSEV